MPTLCSTSTLQVGRLEYSAHGGKAPSSFQGRTSSMRRLTGLAAVALALAASSARADQLLGDVFDPFFRHTGAKPEADLGSTGIALDRLPGESIDPFTGNVRIARTDLALPGRGGLDLRLQRVYSSKIWGRADLLDAEPLLAESEHSVLGYGWSMHMGRLRGLTTMTNPMECGGAYPVFELPDGSSEVFYPALDGDGLVSKEHSRLRTNCSFALGGACIWTSNGLRYDLQGGFNDQYYSGTTPVWPVNRIADPSGNQIAMEYVPQSGALHHITDTYQRVVDFFYTSETDGMRLDGFTASDGRGHSTTFSYFYDRRVNGMPSAGTFPLPGMRRFLVEARPPAGPSETYAYWYDAPVAQNQYALSELVLPSGGTVSYNYESVPFFTGREMVPFTALSSRTISGLPGRGVPPGTWTYSYASPGYKTYSATDPVTGLATDMHVTTVHRPDQHVDTFSIYGFGWIADQDASGYTYLAGRVAEITRADRAEVEIFGWDPNDEALISAVIYAAPLYSGNCGGYWVWDTVVASPVVKVYATTRDGVQFITQYDGFDAYGRPASSKEWAFNQSGYENPARPLPPDVRHTTWTYFTALQAVDGTPLNIVAGHPLTRVTTVGSDQARASWTYSDRGRLLSETENGISTTFGHTGNGDLSSVTDALGHVLTISDYEYGTPKTFDFNGAFRITRQVSWEGRVLLQKDGRGNETGYGYDPAGRLSTIAPPGLTFATTYEYAPDGTWIREQRGAYSRQYNLDGLGRVVASLDSEGTRTTARFDAQGSRWFSSYPYSDTAGEVGAFAYHDGLGRLLTESRAFRPATSTCDGSTCSISYQRTGNCLTTVALQEPGLPTSSVRCTWNYGDPSGGELLQLRDPLGMVWDYRYTAAGKLASVTAPLAQGARSYEYDEHHLLRSEASGESGLTVYDRDGMGLVRTRTDARSILTSYTRDSVLARVKEIHYQGFAADDVALDYDDANNLTLVASNSGGTSTLEYDELNRLYRETWSWMHDGQTTTSTVSYGFDSAGCLEEMTYPSGLVLQLTCDTANRVKTIQANGEVIVRNVQYHPSGQPAVVEYGNGTVTTYSYDDRYRVREISVPGVMDLQYGYDGLDNVTSLTDTQVPFSTRTMYYDLASRLVSVTAPGIWGDGRTIDEPIVYSYDVLGNRSTKDTWSSTRYTYDEKNRLTKVSGLEPLHSMKLTWDGAGRLATSSEGATYRYDGRDRRVAKIDSSGTTLYHYDAAGRVIAESRADGTKLRDFIYLGNTLVAVDGCVGASVPPCSAREWYHTDTLGSATARTDRTGAVSARLRYQPWGEEWSYEGEPGDRQYNGRVYDPGTGFHDYGARMYWPQVGRFISADSYQGDIGNPASLNRYSYVLNNPYKYTDPTGHMPDSAGGGPREEALLQAQMQQATACANGSGSCAPQYAAAATLAVLTGGFVALAAGSEAAVAAAPLAPAAPKLLQEAEEAAPKLSQAGQALMRAEPIGSALKDDVYHRSATFMREVAARTGSTFEITGGDGAKRTLTQVLGKLNDVAGRYEYIVDKAGKLTHQMFVTGGTINGTPIKP
jgi:RHS repeat-associated protein